jgi:hypothetical protein
MSINEIFQFIGAFASIFGLTYAFYIAKNNRKQNIERVKEKIIEKLLFFMGYDNEFDSVEILSVINSALRQYKINENKVLPSEIIEDLISVIICNPLLSSDKKIEINNKLKTVLNEFLFAQGLLNLNDDQRKIVFESDMKDTENVKILIKNNIQNKIEYENSKRKSRLYDYVIIFIFLFIFLLLLSVIVFFSENKNDYVNINWIIVFISLIWIVFIIYDNIRKKKIK